MGNFFICKTTQKTKKQKKEYIIKCVFVWVSKYELFY